MKRIALLFFLFAALSITITAQADDRVTIEQSSITWHTFDYELNEDTSVVRGSFDPNTIVEREFDTWIVENEYLRVTLLPDFGGRILSMIYKPTNHEMLYQNPVGTPYLIGEGIFYYDWLMIYGGIFPTFPEPEHGKTWPLPWNFEIVEDTDEAVTVKMSFVDDIDFAGAPNQYNVGMTNIEVDFYVSLHAGYAALDTRIELRNPGDRRQFEYWTNAGFAPGSEIGNPRTTAGAEIIAPIDEIAIPDFWEAIIAREERTGRGTYEFDALRQFANWDYQGIAYAFPGMNDTNFWGVINHDNEMGIFRIADNTITPGLKIWTFGFESTEVDIEGDGENWLRPFIELWAGVSTQFWIRKTFDAESEIVIEETYMTSAGLNNVTHASDSLLVNAMLDDSTATLAFNSTVPGEPLTVSVLAGGEAQFEEIVLPQAAMAHVIGVNNLPVDESITFEIRDDAANLLLSGEF